MRSYGRDDSAGFFVSAAIMRVTTLLLPAAERGVNPKKLCINFRDLRGVQNRRKEENLDVARMIVGLNDKPG